VQEGTVNADTLWLCVSNRGGSLGSSALSFAGRAGREKLVASRTYYVRSDGSDGNDGLANTAGGAFLTIQKAIDVILGTLDLGGQIVVIQVADGTWTAGMTMSSPQVGAGSVILRGNTGTPGNVIISTTSANCVLVTNYGARLSVEGIEFRTTTSGRGVFASNGSFINIGSGCRFGACASEHILANGPGAVVEAFASYTIAGNAPVHFSAGAGGRISAFFNTITLSGTPAFAGAFARANNLSQIECGSTFSGAATGKRYEATLNAVINSNGGGANFFPGNAAGTTATGAQYA
jgi:hypothetical protein